MGLPRPFGFGFRVQDDEDGDEEDEDRRPGAYLKIGFRVQGLEFRVQKVEGPGFGLRV